MFSTSDLYICDAAAAAAAAAVLLTSAAQRRKDFYLKNFVGRRLSVRLI